MSTVLVSWSHADLHLFGVHLDLVTRDEDAVLVGSLGGDVEVDLHGHPPGIDVQVLQESGHGHPRGRLRHLAVELDLQSEAFIAPGAAEIKGRPTGKKKPRPPMSRGRGSWSVSCAVAHPAGGERRPLERGYRAKLPQTTGRPTWPTRASPVIFRLVRSIE